MEVGVTAQVVTYSTQSIVAEATSVTSVTVSVDDVATTTDPSDRRLAKRSTSCATQPAGATGAPTVSTDTPSAFVSNAAFASVASAAATPTGYDQTFVNLAASNNAYGYMGYTTLQTYDTQSCATKCDKMNGCMAVNVYFERDPSVNPDNADCANPSSVTMIKCVFWGGPVSSANANNAGQWRDSFQVVIAGSNGYVNKTLATPSGYTGPVYLGSAAINAPYDSQGYNTYMGAKVFTSGPFNVQLCADYCTAQNVYNLAHPASNGAPVQTCQFFNTYILYNNTPSNTQGQYCAIYSESWSSSYATNTGQYRGTDHFMIDYSYSFTNSTGMVSPNKNGAVHQASIDITYATLQTYCSTLLGYATPLATVTSTTTITPVLTSTNTELATATVTVTVAAQKKRWDFGGKPYAANQKRQTAVSTPAVLTKYPATVVSSACQLVATAVISTSTITAIASITASPSVTYVTEYDTATLTTSVTAAAVARYHIKQLHSYFEASARPIIFTQHGHTKEELTPPFTNQLVRRWGPNGSIAKGSIDWELVPELVTLAENAPRVHKNTYDAFLNTDLAALLEERTIERVVVCGVMTDCCCDTTGRSAFNRGYETWLVSDACGSANKTQHEAGLQGFGFAFGDVLTTAEATQKLKAE
ncbi:hypothetical protein LTR85_002674 [Meristemomyces frigidus]|nr:hypothetical protein LTR85_002674 [Meristemomyces frigidus]